VALAGCQNTLVVRTSWLYGVHGKNFVTTIMQLAREKPELRVVSDQRGCPTHAGELASTLRRVLSLDLTGIVHAAGSGECSWHELACAIVAHSGAAATVIPITTAEAGRHAPRPAYSVLGNEVLSRYGIVLPHWEESITRFMRDRQAVTAAKS
jgi:dTDP-4-dehydrorhamnose reductase